MEEELLFLEDFPSLTELDCIRIQEELACRVVQQDDFGAPLPRTVAGVDLAYWQEGEEERAVCCIVVLDRESRSVLETAEAHGTVRFPYLPGCFAFRELPLVLEAAAGLRERPGLFLFDGNGVLHPRGLGLASHASFYLETPTMGVAKHYYRVAGAEPPLLGDAPGSQADIVAEGKILGRALRTHAGVKPVFVSVGNRISLDTAAKLSLALTGPESHIPAPTRLADLETHLWREKLRNE